jgi:small subunit ribosomal protein S16
MLTIRFNRVGKKNKPYFRIVLQEHTVAPGGRHVDVLGSYDPHMKKAVFKEEKIKYWISKGAQASDTVHNLLVKNGIITGDKRKVKLPAKKAEEVKEPVRNASPSDARPHDSRSVSDVAGGEKAPEVSVEEVKSEVAEVKTEEALAEEKKEEKKKEVKETEVPKTKEVDKK